MTTREKIIVALMVLSVIYGIYIVFFAGPREEAAFKPGGDKELEALNTFITKVADKTKNNLSKEQAYVLDKAQAEWKQDPLMHIKTPLTKEEEDELQPLKLESEILYTGFLEMGNKRLAILNGVEYEVGDRLEPDGLVIQKILPNHVVIGSPNKRNKKVILPMEEIE
jgi:hypothetical protein